MLRNLLYSISLHLFLFLVLYSDTILYGTEKSLDLMAERREDVDIDKLNKIKKNLFSGNKLNELTLKQKIDLYDNYDKIKSIKTAKYNEIKNKLKDNVIFSTKEQTTDKSQKIQQISTNNIEIDENNYNIVTKESYKVYVEESKLTQQQIKQINKQNELKEKIREQIKVVDNTQQIEESIKQKSLDDLLNDLDKDLIAVNDKTQKEFTIVNTNKHKSTDKELKEIAELMAIDDLDKLIEAKDDISDGDVSTIFTKEDYNKMSKTRNSIYELSFRERSNIQKQIKTCYKNAVLRTQKNSSMIISARIKLDRNGQIDMNNIVFSIEDEANVKDIDRNEYFTTIENIKLALVYCNPLRGLPSYKYNIWKNMNLVFNN